MYLIFDTDTITTNTNTYVWLLCDGNMIDTWCKGDYVIDIFCKEVICLIHYVKELYDWCIVEMGVIRLINSVKGGYMIDK